MAASSSAAGEAKGELPDQQRRGRQQPNNNNREKRKAKQRAKRIVE
jgi:hypothetical protein